MNFLNTVIPSNLNSLALYITIQDVNHGAKLGTGTHLAKNRSESGLPYFDGNQLQVPVQLIWRSM